MSSLLTWLTEVERVVRGTAIQLCTGKAQFNWGLSLRIALNVHSLFEESKQGLLKALGSGKGAREGAGHDNP